MQKKLLVLAVAAAISAPAFAADDSKVSVSVYGILDVGYGSESKTVTTAITGVATKNDQAALNLSALTSSRLGFLANEEMADGTKATVKVETGISSNPMAGFSQTGVNTAGNGVAGSPPVGANGTTLDATTLGSRELNLSLAFTEGTTVKAGYGSTPVRDISLGYAADPGGNLIGNLLNNDATLGSNRVTSLDVIQQFGPVKATVSLSKDKLTQTNAAGITTTVISPGATVGGDAKGYLLAAQYVQDALSASFAYQNLKSTAINAAGVTTADTAQKTAILGVSYDLGAAKLFGEYASIKNADATAIVAPAVAIAGTGSRSYLSLGVQAPFGPVLGFAQVSSGTVNRATGTTVVSESRKESGMTIGAKYNMSKITYAYVSAGSTNLKAGSVDPAAAGVKVSQFALGLVHTF